MKNWIDLGSDSSWEDYGGKWGKRAPDGSWYVIDFTNMYDACGEGECKRDGQDQYVCEVKRVNLSTLPIENVTSALRSCGWKMTEEGIVNEHDGGIVAEIESIHATIVIVEACVGYGCAEPIESFSGDKYPARVRADARRYAETCMKDDALLAERLARPVNKIGSTAEEYGRGDLDSALDRGPFDALKNIMRKLHGKLTIEGM